MANLTILLEFRGQRSCFPFTSTNKACSVWVECQGSVGDHRSYQCESRVREGRAGFKMLEAAARLSVSVGRLIP